MMSRRIATVLCLICLVSSACDDDPTSPSLIEDVTVFQDANVRGDQSTINADRPDLDDTRGPCGVFVTNNNGDWNNCISSIRVPAGWEITIYDEANFQGASLTLTADVGDLETIAGPCGNDWDDCISSFHVRRR